MNGNVDPTYAPGPGFDLTFSVNRNNDTFWFSNGFYLFSRDEIAGGMGNLSVNLRHISLDGYLDTSFGKNGVLPIGQINMMSGQKTARCGFTTDGRFVTAVLTVGMLTGSVSSLDVIVTMPNGDADTSVGPEGKVHLPLPPLTGSQLIYPTNAEAIRCILEN